MVQRDENESGRSSPGRTHPCVLLGPTFADNPYTQQLIDALRDLGHVVEPLDDPGALAEQSEWLAADDVFHLQWAHVFTAGRHLPASVRGTRRLLTQLDAMRKRGVRLVWTVHNLVHHEATGGGLSLAHQGWAMRQIAKRCHALVVHGEHGAAVACNRYGVPASLITVVDHPSFIGSYPIEVSQERARADLDVAPDATVFAHVGLLRRYKGVQALLEAYEIIANEGTVLVVAGRSSDGETADMLRAAAEAGCIRFHEGFVPDDRLQVYFRAADAVVLPYARVFTSGSAALAGTFGRAVIAPAVGCLPDQISDAGMLYDPDDPEGLVAAMKAARDDRRALRDMGARAEALAEQRTWAVLARGVATAYTSPV